MKSVFAENKESLFLAELPINDAVRALDESPIKFLIIINKNGELVGTVTDGDIRRGILKGIPLQSAVSQVMNGSPIVAQEKESPKKYFRALRKIPSSLLPVVNEKKQVIDLLLIDSESSSGIKENPVLILAGGLGTRLGDLTKQTPKSLLPIGDTPIIEMAIQNLVRYGFQRFFISVNYKADMIRESLGNGDRLKCEIQYLQEEDRLGTAGPLSLLDGKVNQPFLVMNGDIVTKIDFDSLFQFHAEHKEMATMCVKEYDMQVPFGVVQLDDNRVTDINEKPVHKFFVSAGINVMNPEAIALVPKKTYFDMPTLFDLILKKNKGVRAFPIMEYWLDVGRHTDLEKAQTDFGKR